MLPRVLILYFGLTYSIESRFIVVAVLLLVVVVFAGEGDDVVFIRGEANAFGEVTPIFPFGCSFLTIITGVVRPNATTVVVDFFRRPDKVTLAP